MPHVDRPDAGKGGDPFGLPVSDQRADRRPDLVLVMAFFVVVFFVAAFFAPVLVAAFLASVLVAVTFLPVAPLALAAFLAVASLGPGFLAFLVPVLAVAALLVAFAVLVVFGPARLGSLDTAAEPPDEPSTVSVPGPGTTVVSFPDGHRTLSIDPVAAATTPSRYGPLPDDKRIRSPIFTTKRTSQLTGREL